MVGGTGLYLQAALTDLELRPPAPADVRERLEGGPGGRGSAALHADLAARGAPAAAAIEPGDRTRVLRALELLEMGGARPGGAARALDRRHAPSHAPVRPRMEREALMTRIDERVDAMVAAAPWRRCAARTRRASRTARAALGFELLPRA